MENTGKVSTEIQVRLLKVQETGFFLDSILLNSVAKFDFNIMQVQFELGFNFDVNADLFNLHLSVRYLYPIDNEIKKITELSSDNQFFVQCLTNMIQLDEKDQMTDKIGILPTLLGIAIGTLRGMLVVKTSGTILADYPLLIVNPSELLKPSIAQNETPTV